MMDVQITTKNLKIDDETREFAERKLNKLEKYLSNISAVKLELLEEKSKSRAHSYAAQVTANVNGFIIRGEQKGDDIRGTIEASLEVMERLVAKYKSRYELNKSKVQESIRKPSPEAQRQADREESGIVKLKRFKVHTMSVDQAVDQMEFIGHDFFIFVSDEDSTINVVYRRKDGRYGLIQPESA
jgi:putative sigma-54 modulation protein